MVMFPGLRAELDALKAETAAETAKLHAMLDDAQAALRKLADVDPSAYDTEWGESCFHCGSRNHSGQIGSAADEKLLHYKDCDWVALRARFDLPLPDRHGMFVPKPPTEPCPTCGQFYWYDDHGESHAHRDDDQHDHCIAAERGVTVEEYRARPYRTLAEMLPPIVAPRGGIRYVTLSSPIDFTRIITDDAVGDGQPPRAPRGGILFEPPPDLVIWRPGAIIRLDGDTESDG